VTAGSYESLRAGRWQRRQANSWLAWRESQESLRRPRLEALATAISQVARGYLVEGTNADVTVRQFPDILRRCDALNFDEAAQTIAYMIWHLADRYGRVTQVLDQLFIRGHRPVRIGGVTILEVGAGPAPALYAVRDYYDDVRAWVAATKQNIHVARATTLNSIDRGPAWSGLLHILSETLLSLTHWQEQAPLPFRIQYNDLSDFSIYGEHARILDLQARAIQDEFDRAGEYVSLHTARQFALDDGV
jgi:hypothetical protein